MHTRAGGAQSSRALVAIGVGFAAGSIPFSNIAARWTRGVDLRTVGSGTVSGTGLYRVAGFGPLALAGVLDVAKGAVGPLLAPSTCPSAAALAGGAAVAGHNWSPFLRGAGGRGISPAIGALLVQAWPGAATLLGGLAFGKLGGETAIGSLVADVVLVPLLARTRGRRGAVAGAAVLVPMIVKRLAGNTPVTHDRRATLVSRLVLDRDPD
jgi:acyl phosphate:glycerol-3-phosphate acyltransferase